MVGFLPFILDVVYASSPSLPASKIQIRDCGKVRNKDAQSSEAAELLSEPWTFLLHDALGSKSWCRFKKWGKAMKEEFVEDYCAHIWCVQVGRSLNCTWKEPGVVGGKASLQAHPDPFFNPPADTCCSQFSLLSQRTYFHLVELFCLGFFGTRC